MGRSICVGGHKCWVTCVRPDGADDGTDQGGPCWRHRAGRLDLLAGAFKVIYHRPCRERVDVRCSNAVLPNMAMLAWRAVPTRVGEKTRSHFLE